MYLSYIVSHALSVDFQTAVCVFVDKVDSKFLVFIKYFLCAFHT